MTSGRDAMTRLRAADPGPPGPEDVGSTEWARELLDQVIEVPGNEVTAPRRRWPRRRALAVAVACLVVAGGGAAVAGIAFDEGTPAPPPIQRSLRAALDLPGPDKASLRPLPGGIRQKLVADTPFGTWGIFEVQTAGRGPLLSWGPLSDDLTLLGASAIGGCPALADGAEIEVCGGGSTRPPASDSPGQHLLGRVGPAVAAVEFRAPGVVERGWVGAGVFLVLLERTPERGPAEVVALDKAGAEVGSHPLTVRTDPGGIPMLLATG